VIESPAVARESDGAEPGDSHVRIVRLSQAQGRLGLDRGTGTIESTMQNMPIVEGSRLATSEGYAEIEFEDGSTLRIAPESQVDFPQLILRSTGVKASTVKLVKGTAYVNLEKSRDIEFTMKAGDAVMKVAPGRPFSRSSTATWR
jgi:ferric-dicitrate binding protein FerR (iron transport regulator)